jgi:hypothetical protein
MDPDLDPKRRQSTDKTVAIPINQKNPNHRNIFNQWFYEYERYDGGDMSLQDDSSTKISRQGRVRLILQDGRKRTLLGVLHIMGLERNLIYVSNMSDVGVHTLFQKDLCKMIKGAMVLMK